jgi:hypothetical protein
VNSVLARSRIRECSIGAFVESRESLVCRFGLNAVGTRQVRAGKLQTGERAKRTIDYDDRIIQKFPILGDRLVRRLQLQVSLATKIGRIEESADSDLRIGVSKVVRRGFALNLDRSRSVLLIEFDCRAHHRLCR